MLVVCREVWSAAARPVPDRGVPRATAPLRACSAAASWPEAGRLADVLRAETVGGALLLVAAALALVWANSPWRRGVRGAGRGPASGPAALHLDLTLAQWAADGLLAIFFFVAGLELKREFVAGDLRDPRRAALPVAAAVGGMVVPAADLRRWSTRAGGGACAAGRSRPPPTSPSPSPCSPSSAPHLPAALRTFLLTLAVVDDLLAIIVIAVFYTGTCALLPLLLALLPLGVFAAAGAAPRPVAGGCCCRSPSPPGRWCTRPGSTPPSPACCSGSPSRCVAGARRTRTPGLAEHFEHRLRPLSAGVAVPVFAFFAAGVSVAGGGLGERSATRSPSGVVVGLVVGKTVGILGATWLRRRGSPAPSWPTS